MPRLSDKVTNLHGIQHFKTWNVLIFPIFCRSFCPPGSGSGFRIRIQSGSGPKTLLEGAFYKIKTSTTSYSDLRNYSLMSKMNFIPWHSPFKKLSVILTEVSLEAPCGHIDGSSLLLLEFRSQLFRKFLQLSGQKETDQDKTVLAKFVSDTVSAGF